jgi:RsiW-degrading membrane proteinase PrsW (M82 family)
VDPLSYLALGFAPGLFWLWIFVRSNRQRPDPLSLVIRTFLLGVLVALPVVFVELLVGGATEPRGLDEIIFTSFIVAGVVEELGKFLVVRLSLRGSPYLDEPLRGLVYASAVALGFASIENVGYVVAEGLEVWAPRSILCTVAHVSFSALWGYGLGADRLASDQGRRPRGFAILGFIAAALVHGAYDVGAFSERADVMLLVFAGATVICIGLFIRANARSIHRGRSGTRMIRCPACDALCPLGKRFCANCGGSLPRRSPVHCGTCHKEIERRAAFCIHCGAHQATEE